MSSRCGTSGKATDDALPGVHRTLENLTRATLAADLIDDSTPLRPQQDAT